MKKIRPIKIGGHVFLSVEKDGDGTWFRVGTKEDNFGVKLSRSQLNKLLKYIGEL